LDDRIYAGRISLSHRGTEQIEHIIAYTKAENSLNVECLSLSQPGFPGTLGFRGRSLGVPREIVGKKYKENVFSHLLLCVFILMITKAISHIWSLQLISKNNIGLLPFLIINIFYGYSVFKRVIRSFQ
jgi:hypothetical protein